MQTYAHMFHLACDDPVMMFWHHGNISLLQDSIVRCMYRTSGKTLAISKPDEKSMLPIMFAVFDRYHASLGVKQMNLIVVDEACNDIRTGLMMHMAYVHDSTSRLMPLSYPTSTTK